MGWAGGIIVFVMVWWTVLFAVLPWGVQPDEGGAPGTMPGAPARPLLMRKVIVTTVITLVIWGAIYGLIESDLISFRDMARRM